MNQQLGKSFSGLLEKHKFQIEALKTVNEFLELLSNTELKCAKFLNEIEEFPLTEKL